MKIYNVFRIYDTPPPPPSIHIFWAPVMAFESVLLYLVTSRISDHLFDLRTYFRWSPQSFGMVERIRNGDM